MPVVFDTVSSLWKGFSRRSESDRCVYRYVQPLPGAMLLGLENRASLVTLDPDSAHNAWVFFATPIGVHTANLLYLSGLYVPLLDRISRYALEFIHGEDEEWIAGKPRRNPFFRRGIAALVFDVHNNRIAQWDGRQSVALDDPGIYRIQLPAQMPFWIAVNADTGEITLKYRKPNAIVSKSGKRRVEFMERTGFIDGLKGPRGFAPGYWFWLLFALVFFAEMILWEAPPRKPVGGLKKGTA